MAILSARPNLNGNTAADFEKHARAINEAASALQAALVAAREVTHGRNYQSGQTAEDRARDITRHEGYIHACLAVEMYAVEIFDKAR